MSARRPSSVYSLLNSGPRIVLLGVLLAAQAGCATVGPDTIPRDRVGYINSIGDSWKEQTLLNVVRLRYADTPVFLEVSQIVSGYTLESSLAAGASLSDAEDILEFGAEGTFTDRPTVTYSPLSGTNFVKKLLAPIPPSTLLFMIQSGWPADLVMRTTVQAVNGNRNQSSPTTGAGDGRFFEIIETLRQIQYSGAFGMRVEEKPDESETSVLFFYRKSHDPASAAMIGKFKDLLDLGEGDRRFRVRFGAVPESPDEIAILTRSVIQIMIEIAAYIEVPEQHLARNHVRPSPIVESDRAANVPPLIRIQSGPEPPDDAFVSTRYADHWFWIENGEFDSKRVFTFLSLILMLSETGEEGRVPVLTIPAG